jgi:TrmH family RNA methyltransferase
MSSDAGRGASADSLPGQRIESPANERLKRVRRLRRSRERNRVQTLVIEGYRELFRAAEAGLRPDEVFVCPQRWTGRNERALVERLARQPGVHISTLSVRAFDSIATQDEPDGLLAVAPRPDVGLSRQPAVGSDSLFVVAESVERPGNLGTIIRTCVAADVSGLIVCDPQVDALAPEVVRASVGTVFGLPLSSVSTTEFVDWARAHGVRLVVTTPDAQAYYWQADVAGPTALVVGSEKRGVSAAMQAAADDLVRIPMSPRIDSINVGVATGVVVFDAVRARRAR